jgi:hypothetical protein
MLVNHRPRSPTTLCYVIECHGVQLRAQLRSVATLVQVTGRTSPANRDLVLAHLRRFTMVPGPLVIDMLDRDGFDAELLQDLICTIEQDPDFADTDVTLVVDPALCETMPSHGRVDVVDSVGEALRDITERINARRAFVVKSVAGLTSRRQASGCR